jgi:hypothetical protein
MIEMNTIYIHEWSLMGGKSIMTTIEDANLTKMAM